jgi:hypothetical protein
MYQGALGLKPVDVVVQDGRQRAIKSKAQEAIEDP